MSRAPAAPEQVGSKYGLTEAPSVAMENPCPRLTQLEDVNHLGA